MKKFLMVLCGISFLIITSANVCALELVLNGGFETGDFKSWNTGTGLEGNWSINPLNDPPFGTSSDPISGSYDAIAAPVNVTTFSLSQTFEVPVGLITSATLSWSDRIENLFGSPDAASWEFRVDIWDELGSTQNIFSTGTGDLGPNDRSFDVTDILYSNVGQSLTLRFQNLSDPDLFNLTLDNISLDVQVDAAPVPEPTTIMLLSAGIMGLAGCRWKKGQRA